MGCSDDYVSYEFQKKQPFSKVYLTGLVRDKKGRKMSKQLGNSPDALELINRYGADAVRVGLMLSSAAGNDLLFDESPVIRVKILQIKFGMLFV